MSIEMSKALLTVDLEAVEARLIAHGNTLVKNMAQSMTQTRQTVFSNGLAQSFQNMPKEKMVPVLTRAGKLRLQAGAVRLARTPIVTQLQVCVLMAVAEPKNFGQGARGRFVVAETVEMPEKLSLQEQKQQLTFLCEIVALRHERPWVLHSAMRTYNGEAGALNPSPDGTTTGRGWDYVVHDEIFGTKVVDYCRGDIAAHTALTKFWRT